MTRLRDVWKRVLISMGGMVLLRKRVDLHTSAELEDIVVSQARAEHDMNSEHAEWWSAREFSAENPTITSFSPYLAPGGRFLLDLDSRAAVVYVDLDANELAWREVIPSSPAQIVTFCKAWEHIANAPILIMRIAISMRRTLLESEREEGSMGVHDDLPIQEISVWRVSAKLDDEGVICGLEAERLSLFRHTQHSEGGGVLFLKTIKLQGDHVILTRGDLCSVINWVEADGLMGSVPGRVVQYPSCLVRFSTRPLEFWIFTAHS